MLHSELSLRMFPRDSRCWRIVSVVLLEDAANSITENERQRVSSLDYTQSLNMQAIPFEEEPSVASSSQLLLTTVTTVTTRYAGSGFATTVDSP